MQTSPSCHYGCAVTDSLARRETETGRRSRVSQGFQISLLVGSSLSGCGPRSSAGWMGPMQGRLGALCRWQYVMRCCPGWRAWIDEDSGSSFCRRSVSIPRRNKTASSILATRQSNE